MEVEFNGDIKGISENQLSSIRNVLQNHGFEKGEALLTPVGSDNYMGNVTRLTIEDGGKMFKMIAKTATQNEMVRFFRLTVSAFKNEIMIYTQVLPKFDELQKSAGIQENVRFKFPICYGSSSEPMHEIILIEDLNVLNYTILDRFKSLSDDCVRLVLTNLAKFHSLSYVLKKQEPETYSVMKNDLHDLWTTYKQMPELSQNLKILHDNTMAIVGNDKYRRVLKGAVDRTSELSDIDARADGKYSVIQHGDAWTNNMMFRFQGDRALDSILIDYQISKETNPVCDLHHMIFYCTDYDMISKYYYDWIDYYYSELDKSLNNFGLKANSVYPRDHFDGDLKRYADITFNKLVILTNMMVISLSEKAGKAKIPHLVKGNITIPFTMTTLDDYSKLVLRKRVEGFIDNFLTFGLLKDNY